MSNNVETTVSRMNLEQRTAALVRFKDSETLIDPENQYVRDLLEAVVGDLTLLEMIACSRSPLCGHWSSHSYSVDPVGAEIQCLECELKKLQEELERLKKVLSASQGERDE